VLYAGQRFTAALAAQMQPDWYVKGTGTTRASTTTFADDPDLIVPVLANKVYLIEFWVKAAALAAADIKTIWNVPAGTTGNRQVVGPGSTAADAGADNITSRWGVHAFATSIAYNGVRDSAANQFWFKEWAIVTVGATAGNIALQWAQVTSNATGSVVAAGSYARSTQTA
jgi:hypothetical protein